MIEIPPLPPDDSHDWYSHYQGLDQALRELQGIVQGLNPVAGFIATVNGVAPDNTGDVTITAASIGALDDSYTPSVADLPLETQMTVLKDTVTGFWPSGWNADGSPIYTGGSASSGVRPTARHVTVEWIGADPSPGSVASGTGGMLRGYDKRAIPGP